jgi:endo-beta-N-acetylglucosaminidase D
VTFLAGDVLTASQLEVETNNKPLCVVNHNTTQSIPNSTVTSMSANTEVHDWSVTAMHDTAVNNSRIVIQQAGLYLITAIVTFPTNTTGRRALEIWVNSATQYRVGQVPPVSGGETTMSCPIYLDLAVSDFVQVRAFQDSGGSLLCTLVQFSAAYVRD